MEGKEISHQGLVFLQDFESQHLVVAGQRAVANHVHKHDRRQPTMFCTGVRHEIEKAICHGHNPAAVSPPGIVPSNHAYARFF